MRCSSAPDLCGWMGAVYEMRSYIERTQTGPDFWTADSSPARRFRYPGQYGLLLPNRVSANSSPDKTLVYPAVHQQCTGILHHFQPQAEDFGIGSFSFFSAVPTVVVITAVGIVPAVCLVMLLVIAV